MTKVLTSCFTYVLSGRTRIKINSVERQKNKIDAFKVTQFVCEVPSVFKFELEISMFIQFARTTRFNIDTVSETSLSH